MYKYALKYSPNIEAREEGYTKEDVKGTDFGLTDCFLGISILLPPDGSYSQCIVSSEHGKERRALTQKEIFKVWLTLGLSLNDQKELNGWHKQLVNSFSDIVRKIFRNNK